MKCYKGTILSVDASDGVYRYHALTPTQSCGFIGQLTTAILMKESQCSRHSEWQMHLERSLLKEQILVNETTEHIFPPRGNP